MVIASEYSTDHVLARADVQCLVAFDIHIDAWPTKRFERIEFEFNGFSLIHCLINSGLATSIRFDSFCAWS